MHHGKYLQQLVQQSQVRVYAQAREASYFS